MAQMVLGLALLISSAMASDDDISDLAAQAQVPEADLRAALASQPGVDAREYLRFDGKLPPAEPTQSAASAAPSVAPGLAERVACIESKESQGRNVANRQGSGAVGVLQYFPATFARGAREMGHPEWSPWSPEQARAVAAHDLAVGRRGQWTVSGC